jgi:hypothetical protein
LRTLTALLAVTLLSTVPVRGQEPKVFLRDPGDLVRMKEALNKDPKRFTSSVHGIKVRADRALGVEPVSVMEKAITPPSGDKHDYMSLSRYWWPDPSKPGGLPYIRRDGETNPEIDKIPDHQNLGRMITAVDALAFAYFITEENKYADHAIRLLRTWFLEPTTRMNPHMRFAQGVPGRAAGRGEGILDAREFSLLVDALGLLETSPSWTDKLQMGLSSWFSEYLKWVLESKNGIDEFSSNNNHGTWYDLQTLALALYTGDRTKAKEIAELAKTKRIGSQIEPDGSQPFELARTRSLDYSMMNLEAFFRLASLAQKVGVDLWHYTTSDGRSIRKALDRLLPFVQGEKTWEEKQIAPIKFDAMYPILLRAGRVYGEKRYLEIADAIPLSDSAKLLARSRVGILE